MTKSQTRTARPTMVPSARSMVAAIVLGAAAGWAGGHLLECSVESPVGSPLESPVIGEPPALQGPRVGAAGEQAKPTLVVQEFNGTVQRVATTPEEEALELLTLSEAERKAAEAVIARRASDLEKFVAEHVTLLVELDTAGKAGDTDDLNRTLARAVLEMWPILSQGSLRLQISRVLSREARVEFDRLINGYWNAIADERGVSNLGDAIGMRLEEAGKVLGKEIEAAYQRAERSGYAIVGFLTADLAIPDEVRAGLRRMAEEFAETHGENATEAQKATLVFQMALMLEGEARATFIQRVRALTGN